MEFTHPPEYFCSLLEDLLASAKKQGADAAEASVAQSNELEIAVRRGKLDDMGINREQGLSLTVYCNGRIGNATASTLSKQAMQTLVGKALSIARVTKPDPCSGLADQALMATRFPDLDLYHPWALSSEEAIALARQTEESSWSAHPCVNRDKSDGASVSTAATLGAYANTHGFCRAEKTTLHNISCSAVAEKNGRMETDAWSETHRDFKRLPNAQLIGQTAGEHAARRLDAGSIKDCRASVLFQAPAAHSLIRHFIAAASGGALYRKTSFLLGKLNSNIFAPHINISELPHLPGELASDAYDDDGVFTRTRPIVENGSWQGCFLSAYSARKLGMTTTGNAGGVHNLEVSGDTVAAGDLPALMQTGVIVTSLMGQGVNPVTGDYSHGAAGFWVENGEICYPVNEITIAGNLLSMLTSIAAVGDDSMRRGAIKCGSLLIPDLTIGGNVGSGQ